MIASLVATLKIDGGLQLEETLGQLRQRTEIEIGQLYGHRLPITLEAAGTYEMEALTQWVQGLEGVVFVDIIFASLDSSGAGE